MANNKRERPFTTLNLDITELPQRPVYTLPTPRAKVKFIKQCEKLIRKSPEYKDYIKFLKEHMGMNRCTVLRGLKSDSNKKYSIEIHHEPFTLFDIVQIILERNISLGIPISEYKISDEVMALHYDKKVGLIPLSKTMHELVHSGRIFIPLQFIYQRYDAFYNEFQPFIETLPTLNEKIEGKVELSMKCPDILSDVVEPEFTYVHIDGFPFPEIPDEWQHIFKVED